MSIPFAHFIQNLILEDVDMMYQRIKELAKKAGVSINQLEKELGIAKGYLSKIDTLKPSNERLTSIANYFGVSLEYLTTSLTSIFTFKP